MHPLLAPGAHLLRRGRDGLQVGLHPGDAIALPRRPEPGARSPLEDPGLLATLTGAGLAVTDDRAVRDALPAVDLDDPWPRHTMAALARRAGPDLEGVRRARAAHVLHVHPFGHPLGATLAADLTAVCARAALPLRRRRPGPRRPDPGPPLHVLVGVGEPTRALTDPWVRAGEAHLLLRLVEGRAVVGPLVVPGRTACLRCIDAYLAEDDPDWPLLVEQYAQACRSDRADGIPEPVDAALAALAVGWVARDLASYVEGGRPVSWSSTLRLAADLGAVESLRWPRHPGCGCGWSAPDI